MDIHHAIIYMLVAVHVSSEQHRLNISTIPFSAYCLHFIACFAALDTAACSPDAKYMLVTPANDVYDAGLSMLFAVSRGIPKPSVLKLLKLGRFWQVACAQRVIIFSGFRPVVTLGGSGGQEDTRI